MSDHTTQAADFKAKRKAANRALKEIFSVIRFRLLLARFFAVVSCIIGVAPYVAMIRIGDLLLAPGELDHDAMRSAVKLLIFAYMNQAFFYFLALVITHFADLKLVNYLRNQVIHRVSRAPLSWFSQSSAGKIRKAIQEDITTLHTLVAHAPVDITVAIVSPIVLLALSFSVDWRMALLSIATLPLFFLGQMIMTKDMGVKTAEMDDKLNDISAVAVELADGIHVVKNFGMTGRAHSRFSQACKSFAKFYWDWCQPLTRSSALSMTFISVATILTITLGGGLLMVQRGWLTLPEMLVCSLIGLLVPHAIEVLTNATWTYQQAGHAALALEELLQVGTTEYGTRQAAEVDNHTVEFHDVSYAYEGSEGHIQALDSVSLRLEPGSVTALVGASGSGKSTLATMLARFRDPDEGSITIGGIDIREFSQLELYKLVSFVLQQTYLQRDTIANLIALYRPDASLEEIQEAARQAQILDEIEALPKGFDTVMGEDTQFSGGQKQRISIARAILADTPILVLDEATASTDPDSEAEIQAALATLAQHRTVLVIGHQAESVRGADQICVLDQGRIQAIGTAEELASNPYWATLTEGVRS